MFFFADPVFSLPNEESLSNRMEAFHRRRADLIPSNESPLPLKDPFILVVHLIPQAAVRGELQFTGAEIKQHARTIPALGDTSGQKRFNVDGLLVYNGRANLRSYTQLFRNGCLEAAMSDAAFATGDGDSLRFLRDNFCEKAVFDVVDQYLKFCVAAAIAAPIRMYSAVVGCKGVYFRTHHGDASDYPIDRSPAFLPPVVIADLGAEVVSSLRPWCDSLAQSAGLERSLSFDGDGAWHERRRSSW